MTVLTINVKLVPAPVIVYVGNGFDGVDNVEFKYSVDSDSNRISWQHLEWLEGKALLILKTNIIFYKEKQEQEVKWIRKIIQTVEQET